VVADTFAGHVHVEWGNSAPVTPFGQMPFFIEFVKQGGLFDGMVADCPLHYTSPKATKKRDVLGTIFLSVLAGWKLALRAYDDGTLRHSESAAPGDDGGGLPGRGTARAR
jgi:hypothetical protein